MHFVHDFMSYFIHNKCKDAKEKKISFFPLHHYSRDWLLVISILG